MLVSFHLFLFLGCSAVGNTSAVLSFSDDRPCRPFCLGPASHSAWAQLYWIRLLPSSLAISTFSVWILLPLCPVISISKFSGSHVWVHVFHVFMFFGVWGEGINPLFLRQEKHNSFEGGYILDSKKWELQKDPKYWLKMAKLKIFFLLVL